MKRNLFAGGLVLALLATVSCSGDSSSSSDTAGGLKGGAVAGRATVPANRPMNPVGGVLPATGTAVTIPTLTKIPFSEPNMPNPIVPNDQLMTVIALGDSFGSGEGNPVTPGNFLYNGWVSPGGQKEKWSYSSDPTVQQSAERCHRSDESGAAKVAKRLTTVSPALTVNFVSFACSGAESKNLIEAPTADLVPTPYIGADADYETQPAIPSQLTQAKQWLLGQPSKRADVVYVSIGGNDAGFGTVVQECFISIRLKLPWERCQDTTIVKNKAANATWNTLRARLQGLASQIRTAFPEAMIIFSQYPDLLSVPTNDPRQIVKDGICSDQDAPIPQNPIIGADVDYVWGVRTPDAFWIRDVFQKKLNGAIVEALKNLPRVYVATSHVNNQRGFCTSNAIVNFNQEALNKQGRDENLVNSWVAGIAGVAFNGTILRATNLKNYLRLDFSKGGWHPNNAGYELYAQAIFDVINKTDARLGNPSAVEQWRSVPIAPDSGVDSLWKSGAITNLLGERGVAVSWNDRSFNESSYEVTLTLASGKVRTASLPAGSTKFEVYDPTLGQSPIKIEVKACHNHNGKGGGECSASISGIL